MSSIFQIPLFLSYQCHLLARWLFNRHPSRRIARSNANLAHNLPQARTIAVAQAVLGGTATIEEWRRACWAELAAAVVAAAITGGFGDFRG